MKTNQKQAWAFRAGLRTPTIKDAYTIIADIKARGFDEQTGYGQFVAARALKPELDMQGFSEIYRLVQAELDADRYIQSAPQIGIATHILNDGREKRVRIEETNEYFIRWTEETTGMTGTSLHSMITSLETL